MPKIGDIYQRDDRFLTVDFELAASGENQHWLFVTKIRGAAIGWQPQFGDVIGFRLNNEYLHFESKLEYFEAYQRLPIIIEVRRMNELRAPVCEFLFHCESRLVY